jgi:hypothetical protein
MPADRREWLSDRLRTPQDDALVDTVAELIELRVHPENIARRVGQNSVKSLARKLYHLDARHLLVGLRDPLADQKRAAGPMTRREVRGK